MKLPFWKNVFLISLSLLLMNCAALTPEPGDKAHRSIEVEGGNQYYYYLESQLQKKKGNIDAAISYILLAAKEDPDSLYLQTEYAFFLLEKNEYEKALAVVERLLEKDPDHIEGLIIYGSIKQSMKEMDEAKFAFEKVLAKDPKRKNIYLFLGSIYMSEENLSQAFDVYEKFVASFPESYIGYFFLGKILSKQEDFDGAKEYFTKALDIEPMLLEPRFELLAIYQAEGLETHPKNKEKIITEYGAILERYPENIRAVMELGVFYHRIGEKGKADTLFSDLGQRSLTDRNITEKGIVLFMKPKKYEDAVIVFNGMLKGVPGNPDIHYLLGAANEGLGKDDAAVQHFQKVGGDSPFFENAVIFSVTIYQKQGKTEKAIDLLEYAIRKLPDTPDFYMYLSHIYEEKEEYDTAAAVLKDGISVNKKEVRLIFRLGVIYDKWGKKEASILEMKKVIIIDPKNAQALNYLGYTYLDMDIKIAEAELLIRKAVALAPKDGYITDSLGWLYYKKGQFQEAVDILEEAIALVPDDPIILEHLGDAYSKLNDREKALEFYIRSLSVKEKDTADLKKKIEGLSDRDEL